MFIDKQNDQMGGSPGLVVEGGDSCSKGRGFKSQQRALNGYYLTFICCKDFNICLKRRKSTKRGWGSPSEKYPDCNLEMFCQ